MNNKTFDDVYEILQEASVLLDDLKSEKEDEVEEFIDAIAVDDEELEEEMRGKIDELDEALGYIYNAMDVLEEFN